MVEANPSIVNKLSKSQALRVVFEYFDQAD
jgi:hypothetical protein